jgi:hypothetical protein
MRSILMAAAVAALAGGVSADVFNDNVGNHLDGGDLHDFFASQGFNHLDIVSVGITNDATNLYVDVTLNADLDATNWGKYALAINNGTSPSDAGNGWGRNIDWNGQTITHWVATWADDFGTGIGGQVWSFDGANWNETGGLAGSDDSQHAAGRQIFTVALADLGLGFGDVMLFDLVSTGGGNDPGVDHLSNASFATDDWGVTSVAGNFLAYTIVPAPSALALLGLGGLAAARRRR